MAEDTLIGMTLGGGQIISLLGTGGMAKVYRAYQEHLERDVAIKVLPPSYVTDPSFIDRFQLEARAMAKLHHPHIVTIYDAGQHEEWLYIVMEYITGGNLRERMERPMRISEAAHIFQDVADALRYAHERGIIHRDVKPVNVLLDTSSHQSQWPRAVLTDFGIAKIMESTNHITTTGAGLGTPEYMSPEQCQGQAVDQRSDIYSLGIMLYEMLCGRPPFLGGSFTAIAHAHVYTPVPSPETFNPQLSPAIQAVVLKALQKRPEQRYQSAAEMALAFNTALQSGMARPSTRPLTNPCPQCRHMNPSAMNFCSRCGANMRGGPAAPLPPKVTLELTTVTCLNCGASNPGANRHCTHCGARLATVICTTCGRSNPAGQHACLNCGQPIVAYH